MVSEKPVAPTVIVTRPLPDGADFAEQCREAGLSPILAPLIDVQLLKPAISLDEVGALAFTSANGVRAFCALIERPALPVFAVGEATGQMARRAGFTEIYEAGGDAASLKDLIISQRDVFSGVVLHCAGTTVRKDLIRGLEIAGIPARKVVLYDAVAAERLPSQLQAAFNEEPRSCWVSFFSPRTANIFAGHVEQEGLAPQLSSMGAVCLSEAVAAGDYSFALGGG